MKVGIIRYPGSNCDNDTLRFFKNSFYISHLEKKLPQIDLLVIPGGFAFGDRVYENATGTYKISPGEKAKNCPVTHLIYEAQKRKVPIFGICNGFQILIQLGLLPGRLVKNNNGNFISKNVDLYFKTDLFGNSELSDKKFSVPVAHAFGNYKISLEEYNEMKVNSQIFMSYDSNVNGSFENIAGVCDKDHLIYGIMPHLERSHEKEVFQKVFEKIFTREDKLRRSIENVMNSEHVSYKSTSKYLKKIFTKGDHVVQGPGENAGIIELGEDYCLALRIESHNHPTFIDPYQGSQTGVGGILRDIFTMGARPIAILDFLRFGNDDRSERLIKETIRGISDYGNCIGVANVGGDFIRDDTYNLNPLLNVACLGLVKKENIVYGHALEEGLLLIYVGARTGMEGVGGADMASRSFGSNVSDLRDNVQTGDPFLERLLLEACCEISERKLAHGMQDMGAAGMLCASMEVVKRGREKSGKDLGCEVYIDKVPLKTRMETSDILLSETQERMMIVATEENSKSISEIFNKWDLEYSVVGKVTNTGEYTVLRDGLKEYSERYEDFPDPKLEWQLNYPERKFSKSKKIKNTKLWEIYDSTIGGRTLKGPLEKESYSILDIYEIGKKLLITWGSDFEDCNLKMKEFNVKPLCAVNCLNFGHPSDSMGNFKNIVEKMSKDCEKHGVPIVGGNVSLYNSTNGYSIKPTVVMMTVGLMD